MINIPLYDKPLYNGCEKSFLQFSERPASPELDGILRPAVIVFPGGGYEFLSDREAYPVADLFSSHGCVSFILRYAIKPYCGEINPLLDAARAIIYLREHAEEYRIDPHKIAVCGFSAGGHLAGYISTRYDDERVLEKLGAKKGDARPDASILCYPVVTSVKATHRHSFINLYGKDADEFTEDELRRVSLELNVTESTPPAFIWTTADDALVPSSNSLLYASALYEHGVPYELHVFPSGAHGLAMADRGTRPALDHDGVYVSPYVARWTEWAASWLYYTFYGDKAYIR